MKYAVIDIEGDIKTREIYAIVINDFEKYRIYTPYGVSEDEIENFIMRRGLPIEHYEVSNLSDMLLFLLNGYVLIGWNIHFDLHMFVSIFPQFFPETARFNVIDMYRVIKAITGRDYKLWEFVQEYFHYRIYRYGRGFFEKAERWKKCLVDVYFTTKAFLKFRREAENMITVIEVPNPLYALK